LNQGVQLKLIAHSRLAEVAAQPDAVQLLGELGADRDQVQQVVPLQSHRQVQPHMLRSPVQTATRECRRRQLHLGALTWLIGERQLLLREQMAAQEAPVRAMPLRCASSPLARPTKP
jgi:hypothetical protein